MRVGVIELPPFVLKQNGALTGFGIELWDAIAAQLNLKTDYRMIPDGTTLEAALRAKQVDAVVTPVFITSARDAEFDFSCPLMMRRACGSYPALP